MSTFVTVLRLPRGPDPNGRGFDPNSPRFIALSPTTISASTETRTDPVEIGEEQRARSALRESFLRTLIAMTNKQVQFHMYERVNVEAKFGASDIDVLNFQVSELQTPIGVQKEALLSFQFNVRPLEGDVSTVFTTGMSGGNHSIGFSDDQLPSPFH